MRLVQKKHVIWKTIDSEAVFLDSWNGNYFSLNESGSRIWELLNLGLSADAVAEAISREYDVPLSEASADISELFKTLVDAGLAEAQPSSNED